jgi:DNA-binding GntR family transcriptional regulator
VLTDKESRRPRKARPAAQILDAEDNSDTIYERVLIAVMEHRLVPGTKLVEEKLAAVFKVNRTRIRKVLARLTQPGRTWQR